MMRGSFLTMEGGEGAGKSTMMERVAAWLEAEGRRVVQTREPGGTALAEALRELFLRHDMDALTEVLLVFAARRDHLRRLIEPALANGADVICDRFTDATFAYQGGGRGFDAVQLRQLESWVQAGRQPDLTLWFDLPAAIAAERRRGARAADRLESEDVAFFDRVRAGYRQRLDEAPRRVERIDATPSIDAVSEQVAAVLRRRGWL